MLVTFHICWLKTNFLSMLTTDIQYLTSLCLLRSISQWFPHFPRSLAHQTAPHSQARASHCHIPWLYRSSSLVEIVPASPPVPGRSWYHSLPKTPLLSLQPWNPSFPSLVFPSPKHASLAALDQLFFSVSFFREGQRLCLLLKMSHLSNKWVHEWMDKMNVRLLLS